MFGCTSRLLGRCYLILIGVDLEIFVYITSHCSYISFLKTGIHLPFNRFINLSHDIFWKEKKSMEAGKFHGEYCIFIFSERLCHAFGQTKLDTFSVYVITCVKNFSLYTI